MQSFAVERVLRLAGWVELFLSTIAGGNALGARLYLASRGQGADENAFGVGDLKANWCLYLGRREARYDLSQLLSQYPCLYSNFLWDLIDKLIPRDSVRYLLDVRHKEVHSLHLAFS